jgi:RHS repeat-associated protein
VLGTPVAAVNASTGVIGEQLFAPYGQARYSASAPTNGGLHTTLGFTGQHADAGFPGASGLDYFEARYLDPVVGRFTSADDAHPGLGDPSGMDSYAYVQGMVESATDPTGHFLDAEVGGGAGGMSAAEGELALDAAANLEPTVVEFEGGVEGEVGDWVAALESGGADAASVDAAGGGEVVTPGDAPYSELGYREAEAQAADQAAADATPAAGDLPENQFRFEQEQEQLAHSSSGGGGGGGSGGGAGGGGGTPPGEGGAPGGSAGPSDGAGSTGEPGGDTGGDPSETQTCGESFAPDTAVATPTGERAIASLKVGDHVTAYDPKSGTTSTRTVQHVFVDHDTDRLDVTLHLGGATTASSASMSANDDAVGRLAWNTARAQHTSSHSRTARGSDDVVHTTARHPWLTADRGWVRAGQLRPGEPIVRAAGGSAVVVALRVVPGAGPMWDLTVSQMHTFTVGTGEYVVHNCGVTPEQQVDDAIKRARSDPNKEHHIFDNPTHEHNWDATGQDRDGNWSLIGDTLRQTFQDVTRGGRFEVTQSFGPFSVTMRGTFANGNIFIGTGWVNVP